MSRIAPITPPPRPALDVRDLEVVLAVAEARSTVRAADRLHLTQSAVSRALLAAETRLGVALFRRTPRGLTPTAAGARLIEGAGGVLAQLVALERQVVAPAPAPRRLRVVCECYTAYRWLPSAVAGLARALPGVELELAFEHTGDPVAGLAAGTLDVALVTNAPVRAPLRALPLFADEVVVVVAADHPLAERPTITADDLRPHALLLATTTPEAERRWFVRAVFGGRAPALRTLRFPLTEAIVDAARAGMGVAVLSEWIAAAYVDRGLAVRRLHEPLRRSWRLAFRPEVADAARPLAVALAGVAPRLYA